MSIVLGALVPLIAFAIGAAVADPLGIPTPVGGVIGVIVGFVGVERSDLSAAVGFGAPAGAGPSAPRRAINDTKGTVIYEADDGWVALHPASQMTASGETPQAADGAITAKLVEHGWLDEGVDGDKHPSSRASTPENTDKTEAGES